MLGRRKLIYLFPLVLVPLSACAMVLGIEDREFVPVAQVSCENYCNVAMTNCTAEFALYASHESCMGTCAKLDLGKLGDDGVDTVACRMRNAELAGQTGEKADYCTNAGPGGNGACGANCGSYCFLMRQVCPSVFATDMDCMSACAAVPDHGNYDIGDQLEDSVQCRLYHLSSSTIDTSHCEHAAGITKCVEQSDAGADGG